jgi:hypothetical protein
VLDESCFQRTPLAFTGSTQLRWGGINGSSQNITGHFVTDSHPAPGLVGKLFAQHTVVPKNSIWAQNPIPDYGSDGGAPSFPPRCEESKDCQGGRERGASDNPCRCSGEWGESFMCVYWVAVPKALRARRVNRRPQRRRGG